ncbi:hypothetical protein [Limosilactobacillus vaginalis]|uniref:hypothetical protein n=1 Tax=Limosilactobacillus vaginalis TaxID=1633 RepID=UPI0025A355C8|nr:hypothetical protein [Limosilactobacillus vaginalis]MDM8303717.1 hypothetical protein [Limosilactobacillus vaginalis]
MSTLFVEPSASLFKALGYLAEQSHNPDQCPDRNLMVDSNCSDVSEFFAETERRIAKANRLRNHLYSVRLSFSRDEFDPTQATDQDLAFELSKEFVESWLKEKGINRPYIVALQADGKSGLLHSHIYICNPGADAKGIPKGVSALKMQDLNDKVTREFMLKHDRSTAVQDKLMANKKQHDHNSMGASVGEQHYGKSKANAKAVDNKEYMKKAMMSALKQATSRQEFLQLILQQNIYLNRDANKSSDDLWLRHDGGFRKSLSFEYRGTPGRTATLLGLSLEQIDQRLKWNAKLKQNQNQKQLSVPIQHAHQHKRSKVKFHSLKLVKAKAKTAEKTAAKTVLPKPHLNLQELLNEKYRELIKINEQLSDPKLPKSKREYLEKIKPGVVQAVSELESAFFVGETQKEVWRRKKKERELEKESAPES